MGKGLAHNIGRTWLFLFIFAIFLLEFGSYVATSRKSDQSSSLYVWLLFTGMISLNILLIIPYTLSLTGQRKVSTGVHRYLDDSHLTRVRAGGGTA